jgi:hypothetical protein
MTIRYTNSFSEVLTFQIYTYTRSPFLIGVVAVILALDASNIWESLSEEASDSVSPLAIAITEAIVSLLVMIFILAALAVFAARDKRSRAEHVITLTDSALIEETSFRRAEYPWHGLVRLKHIMGNLFLYTAPSEAVIIPRRAFASDAEWYAFQAFCVDRTGKA